MHLPPSSPLVPAVVPAHAYIGRLPGGGAGEVRSVALSAALYSGDVGKGTAPLAGAAAEPLEASVFRDANGTTLRFARRMGKAGLPAGAVAVELDGAANAGVAYLNWAYGPSDELVYHGPTSCGYIEQELRSAAAEAAAASAAAPAPAAAPASASRARRNAALPTSRLRTHGRLMLIAWAGLLPAGAVLGRLVQRPRLRPYSLYAHVAVQASGLAVATVSFALIVTGAHYGPGALVVVLDERAQPDASMPAQRCAMWSASTTRSAFRTPTARWAWPRWRCCGRSR